MHDWPNGVSHAYMIKQGNETKTCNPSDVSWSSNVVSWSWNDWSGEFHDERLIANKAKIVWKFEADDPRVSGCNTIQEICSWLMTKILAGSRFFDVYSWLPGLGWKYGKFYLGTPTQFSGEGIPGGTSKEMATVKMELHWIEVGGSGSGTIIS